MNEERTILFLMSVPRSGSTVVQDHLAATLEGALTAPVTWIIPFALAARGKLSFSPIDIGTARLAKKHFGPAAYDPHLLLGISSFLAFMLDIMPGEKIFVDKTKKNIFYYREISSLPPYSFQITLFRHPIEFAVSSFVHSCHGLPNLAKISIDLCNRYDALADIFRIGDATLVRYDYVKSDSGSSIRADLRKAGISLCQDNVLYDGEVLRGSGMGDQKFKVLRSLNENDLCKCEPRMNSFVIYLVLAALLKRKSDQHVLESIYNRRPNEVRIALRKDVKSYGRLEFIALGDGFLSALFNLKVTIFKIRFSFLRVYLK